MSITVRFWSAKELEQAQSDGWLATLLMNKSTYSRQEMEANSVLPFPKRTFLLYWDDYLGVTEAEREVKAPNIELLKRFIDAEYDRMPDQCIEKIVEHRHINLKVKLEGAVAYLVKGEKS